MAYVELYLISIVHIDTLFFLQASDLGMFAGTYEPAIPEESQEEGIMTHAWKSIDLKFSFIVCP